MQPVGAGKFHERVDPVLIAKPAMPQSEVDRDGVATSIGTAQSV